MRLRHVSKWLSRAPNTVSPIVFRLEQRELIERSFDPGDRRLILLNLTPEGNEILNPSNEASWKVIAEAMAAGITHSPRKIEDLVWLSN